MKGFRRHRSPLPRALLSASFLCLAVLCSGCVERTLVIKTESPARPVEVFIDGKYKGTAPYSAPFLYYGTHEVMLRDATGAVAVAEIRLARPWYEYFPLDFFTDVLLPARVRDRRVFVLPAPKAEMKEFDEIEKNARAFRHKFLRVRGPEAHK